MAQAYIKHLSPLKTAQVGFPRLGTLHLSGPWHQTRSPRAWHRRRRSVRRGKASGRIWKEPWANEGANVHNEGGRIGWVYLDGRSTGGASIVVI